MITDSEVVTKAKKVIREAEKVVNDTANACASAENHIYDPEVIVRQEARDTARREEREKSAND